MLSRYFADEANYARHIFHCMNEGTRSGTIVQQAAPPGQQEAKSR
jgi:hypothetical protein